MIALLPEIAKIKCWASGQEREVSTLVPGDRCLGYDPRHKELMVLSVRQVGRTAPEPVMALFLEHFRWCHYFGGTQVFTIHGTAPMRDNPPVLMSYCVVNPKRMVAKSPIDFMEKGPVPGVSVEWDGDALLWAEGLLVGTTNL